MKNRLEAATDFDVLAGRVHMEAAQKLVDGPGATRRPRGKHSIYVIIGMGHVKVGRAHGHPKRRLNALQSASPFPMRLYAFRETDDPSFSERHSHYLLRNQHVRGEWFLVTPLVALRAVIWSVELAKAAALGLVERPILPPRTNASIFTAGFEIGAEEI